MATFHREKEVQSSVQELRDRGRPSKGVFINRKKLEVHASQVHPRCADTPNGLVITLEKW